MKNKTSYGYDLNKMNNECYQLRKNVMSVIYEAKSKGFSLPRIEVRIVNGGQKNIVGYAYLNTNIIHISEKYAKINKANLTHLVLHEIVHAVTGFKHDKKCYLMKPIIPCCPLLTKTWTAFEKYIKKNKERTLVKQG
tara:strand:+ start:110 stop:520 length:411 start_codon:yes stop_codon:yes gene_type:complete